MAIGGVGATACSHAVRGHAETAMGTLASAETTIAGEAYKNSPSVKVDPAVADLLGGDYLDIAEAGGNAPTNDYWRHVELRWNDYDAACIGARAPKP